MDVLSELNPLILIIAVIVALILTPLVFKTLGWILKLAISLFIFVLLVLIIIRFLG